FHTPLILKEECGVEGENPHHWVTDNGSAIKGGLTRQILCDRLKLIASVDVGVGGKRLIVDAHQPAKTHEVMAGGKARVVMHLEVVLKIGSLPLVVSSGSKRADHGDRRGEKGGSAMAAVAPPAKGHLIDQMAIDQHRVPDLSDICQVVTGGGLLRKAQRADSDAGAIDAVDDVLKGHNMLAELP